MKTDLSKILSVSGQSGLFLYVSHARNGVIAESLADKKRSAFGMTSKITSLADISIYTDEEEVKLQQVADVDTGLDSTAVDELGDGCVGFAKSVAVQFLGNQDSPVSTVGNIGGEEHQNNAHNETLRAEGLTQKLVATDGEESDQHTGQGGDNTQATQQDDAQTAQKSTANSAQNTQQEILLDDFGSGILPVSRLLIIGPIGRLLIVDLLLVSGLLGLLICGLLGLLTGYFGQICTAAGAEFLVGVDGIAAIGTVHRKYLSL